MSSWFDGYAKRAARSEVSASASTEGITRRQALIGGAVATGVMWTAPALLSATPPPTPASCPNNAVRCGDTGPNGLKPCCLNATDTCPVETNVCTGQGQLGGLCKTPNGQGTSGCNNTSSTSIACNGVGGNNICGGVGARCNAPSDCSPSAPFCKGTTQQNKVCSTTGPNGIVTV